MINFGTSASAGCIRLAVKDVKWIYNNIPTGTIVEFYSSADPGPLGKPSAQKISGNEECRNWDPTDTSEGNPWKTYREKEDTTNKNNINNSNENNFVKNEVENNNTSINTVNKITNNTIINNDKVNNTNSSINNVVINKNAVVNNKVNNNENTNR